MSPLQREQIVRYVYPSINVHWYNAANSSLSLNSFNILSNEIENQASFSTCAIFCLPHLFIYIWKFYIFYVQIFLTCCVENFLFHLISILNVLLISVTQNLAYCLFRRFFLFPPTGYVMQSREAVAFCFYLIYSSAVCQIHIVQII